MRRRALGHLLQRILAADLLHRRPDCLGAFALVAGDLLDMTLFAVFAVERWTFAAVGLG
jgi:hypothetical protein